MFAPPMGIALGRCQAINFPESNLHSQPRLSRALHAKTSEGSVQFLVRRFRRQAGRAPRLLDVDVQESVPCPERRGFRVRCLINPAEALKAFGASDPQRSSAIAQDPSTLEGLTTGGGYLQLGSKSDRRSKRYLPRCHNGSTPSRCDQCTCLVPL